MKFLQLLKRSRLLVDRKVALGRTKTCLSLLLFSLLSSYGIKAQNVVTGKVTFAGNALRDVSVQVKNTSVGTTTDESGNYQIKVPSGGKIGRAHV